MRLIAAFMWSKAKRNSISTLIFDTDDIKVLSPPTKHFLPKNYFSFRQSIRKITNDFFQQIIELNKQSEKSVSVEFKIVFRTHEIAYMKASADSLYVLKYFMQCVKKTKKKIKNIELQPQLRKRLTGRSLKLFKKELQSLYLVSRKRNGGFEYHLWAIALHATKATYADKLRQIRHKLVDSMWDENIS